METRISLNDLSIDEITRKFKALKNDSSILFMTLIIKRKPNLETFDSMKSSEKSADDHKKTFGPSNVDKLYEKRTQSKQNSSKNIKAAETLGVINQNQKEDKLYIRNENLSSKIERNPVFNFIKDKRLKKGLKYYDTGNYEEAIRVFQQIKQEYETELDNLVYPHSKKQKEENEIELIEMKRNISNLTFHLANCYFKKKNFDYAISLYVSDYPEESPKQKGIRKGNLATCYAWQQKNQLALSYFKEALNILSQFQEVDLSNIYYNVGVIYLKQNMPQAATKCLKLSIDQRKEKSPENQQMLFNTYFKLGIAFREMNLIEEGLKVLITAESFAQRGISSSKNSLFEVEKEIALCYQGLEKWSQAFSYYESMLNQVEDNALGKAYLFRQVAKIYRSNGKFSEMKKCLKIAADQYQKAGDIKTFQIIKSELRVYN